VKLFKLTGSLSGGQKTAVGIAASEFQLRVNFSKIRVAEGGGRNQKQDQDQRDQRKQPSAGLAGHSDCQPSRSEHRKEL